ncbi:adenosylcobinamide-phosphate synthase CbiB [Marinisporobacter balticus]|uniref:Cobalamin biosynthesis protein CobD n=1 Tax=Marinisporobacter balticus TaxID=2018667 RepID=A0A4R2KXZ9_9FIRM|nr:adenosylcobinamide-phosphate synthase CbiB [Marinisporobacter balticus]TCO79501.1 adenosylcobinamide-phosphate synthase [Marinisporobacter balticus]
MITIGIMVKIITIGYIADLIWGDPYCLPHPIIFVGRGIKNIEKILRRFCKSNDHEKLIGVFLTIIVVSTAYLIPFSLIYSAKLIHPYIGYGIECFLIFQILAAKSLDIESRKVLLQLENGNIHEARKYLSYIVGRETSQLNEEEIVRATIETVAENTTDGIIAPLFYIILGGAPLGMAYKAANTLDSMVGYKNERYLYFGWASAKFDDLLNYIPARLTAFFMIIVSFALKYDWKNCIKIIKRDRRNHKSPNCAYPESAVAGALGIQIGGINTYFGQKVYKPTIGDPLKVLEKEDINRSIQMMYGTSFVSFMVFIILKIGITL